MSALPQAIVMRKKQRHIVRKQLYEALYPERLHLDFIAALAGDRDLTGDEQKHFQRLQARHGDKIYVDLNVTISLGVATCHLNAKSARALITKADKALYQSKSNGKNKVTFFQA